ncbi:MAG: hypothetical protein M3019_04550 [Candidatus Dormibacteraeota bacterium]|nr:hypothetical protein [Candidatus Dormibacteraeota bacterium]
MSTHRTNHVAHRRRRALFLPAAAGLAGVLLTTTTTTVHSASAAPGFGTPVASGIQGNGFEQDLRLDTQSGYFYTSAPQSLSSTISDVWRSFDGGQTFKLIPASVQPAGKPITCAGGGDSELAVDSSGSLFFNDLTLANFSTARSDDHGTSFGANVSCNGVPDAGVDRQWYAVDGSVTNGGFLNLAYDRVAQTTPQQTPVVCPNGSPAGAAQNVLVLAQSPLLPGVQAGVNFGPSQSLSCDEGIMGNDEYFKYADGKRVFVVHDSAAFNSVSMARCDEVGVSVATPTGYANCQDKLISSFPTAKTGGNFPTMSVDRQGHLFAIWEQAPITVAAGVTTVTGNTSLRYSVSVDEGNTWSAALPVPTPGLNNDVFAWPGAGDNGAVDVAFLGTPATFQGTAGPDSTVGDWSLYMVQFLPGVGWSAPILASEHHIHHGTIQTVLGGQTGDRTLGDFIQLRIGSQGEANISYSDSNNIDEGSTPEAMFVRQNSGSSVFPPATVTGTPAPTGNCTNDPAGDGTFDSNGSVGANQPNLDLLRACMAKPDSTHYQVTMKVADLTSLAPTAGSGGTTLLWQTQWHVPSSTDPHGGALFMVYMESVLGQAPTCWVGQNATTTVGGGVALTYPGSTKLTGTACAYTPTAPGTITITVPTAAVTEAGALDNILYTVTASTQSLGSGNAETPPSLGGIGGQLFNLLDVVPGFDFNPAVPTAGIPEAPWTALFVVAAGVAVAVGVRRRRQARG